MKAQRLVLASLLFSGIAAFASGAQAQGALVMYCGVQEEWCRAMVNGFEKETGIKVSMTRKSSGEIYAQVKAEVAKPRADIWWGGTGDPHMQAAEEGLTVEYKSPAMADLQDWAAAPMGAVEEPRDRHLFRRARLRLQHRAGEGEGPDDRNAGRTSSTRSSRTRCRWRTRTRRAPPTRCSRRSCRSWARTRVSTISRPCTRTSTSTPSPAPRPPRPPRSARPPSASPSCTTW